jgi:hypothetical protein
MLRPGVDERSGVVHRVTRASSWSIGGGSSVTIQLCSIRFQLALQLCSQRPNSTRDARSLLSYWERVDFAVVGGELQARNHAVRVLLAAQPDCGGTSTGYYDALFFSGTGVRGSHEADAFPRRCAQHCSSRRSATLARHPWNGTHLRIRTIDPWTIRLNGCRLSS